MKPKRFLFLPFAAFLLIAILTPSVLNAASVTLTVPTDYSTIQAAIDDAVNLAAANPGNSYSVFVEPGSYSGPITLHSNVPVQGRETARTFITGGGSTAITASGATGVSLRNFTIINASVGIDVSNNASVSITNNVFNVGLEGTAIQIQGSQSTEVINNTFYQNGTAVFRDSENIKIINNIFSNNSTNISQSASITENNISFNCFNPAPSPTEPKGANYIPNISYPDPDPSFVDLTSATKDFHLKENSPCIDNGDPSRSDPSPIPPATTNTSDIGAYGGPNADTIPFLVTVSTPTVTGTGPYTVNLSWSQNLGYMVTNTDPAKRGGYKIYYSLNQPGPPYSGTTASTGITEGDSPINAAYTTTGTLSGLSGATAPVAPTLLSVGFANEMLKLTWTPVTGATSYTIYYIDNDAPMPTEQSIPVPSYPTSFDLTGLVNLHHYSLAVTASTQNILYVAVTAYDSTAQTKDPGVQHESAYSEQKFAYIGDPAESAKVYDPNTYFPEAITPNPNLPNKGCFIATAAYGHYSAPQVQALRDFRDRYLMTSAPGRAFVSWYHKYGPVAAQFITDHPWLKPVVRTALLPAVGGALFVTRTSEFEKTVVLSIMMVGIGCFLYRRKLLRTGGRQ